ncbi:hypothetical protein QJS10_CPB21g00491 [Acorus calamus]|uniref:Uncharacterized protein n=1 Tax=Acorus calamus TaxID=4465 RepID=A0AAV9C570_ACOCL|nr:hypothetical protein QJS10_CPB21g00491 [Acorus calamus]
MFKKLIIVIPVIVDSNGFGTSVFIKQRFSVLTNRRMTRGEGTREPHVLSLTEIAPSPPVWSSLPSHSVTKKKKTDHTLLSHPLQKKTKQNKKTSLGLISPHPPLGLPDAAPFRNHRNHCHPNPSHHPSKPYPQPPQPPPSKP